MKELGERLPHSDNVGKILIDVWTDFLSMSSNKAL